MFRQRDRFRIAAAALLIAVSGLFAAQSGFAEERRPANGDCAAPPDSRPQDRSQRNGRNLSQKLDRCNGELKAPDVGDSDLVEPAPSIGNTPVIRPDDLPPHRNPSSNPGGR
ncbi:hypothetical protein [Rhizobium sp. LCM 4573]|uniref:hypothetical protein n=1 Tax=Rhizobium sp. LCM 4573 TaxID=1848291 RepID=UPI0008DA3469|nr:hypothetical protein [Rhizobium sp. LCM 4573]OHV84942.1 hypothetical protein LCM4573_04650 [Rhizobium sp. LCM 4573]